MRIDLSCPIEVRGYVLSYTEHGMQASVRLYNLTPRRIASFEAAARWHRREDGKSIVCPFSMERLHAAGKSLFQITLDNSRLPDADRLEILFNTVRFQDGDSEWHAGSGPFAEMQPLPAIDGDQLEMLKNAAGPDAVCFPRQDSQTWTCVCGRMNSNNDDGCARCHRDHFAALSHTPERVCSAQRAELESGESSLSDLRRSFLRRRSRMLRRTLLLALSALAVTAFLVSREAPPRVPQLETAAVLAVSDE